MGTKHVHTISYHSEANGMVKCFHRPLKAAVRCHQRDQWTSELPTVLLGIRALWREDLKKISAKLVYGQPLRLPGEFIVKTSKNLKPILFYIT